MKNIWRPVFATTIVGLLLVITNAPSDAAQRAARRSAYDGEWSVAIYTLRGDCGAVRFALRSSATAYTQLIKAIRPPALSDQGARSGLLSLEAVNRPLAPAGSHVIPALVDGVR